MTGNIDLMTLALAPDTWHLVCLQDELCQGKGTFFSITRGRSNKRLTSLKELNVLFCLSKPFITVKQSCQTPVVPEWGYLLLAYVSKL